ncbi:Universal stress protein PHOS34 [Bienertia sinuspersici]
MELEGKKIGVAMDFSKGSKAALKWAMDGLLKEGNNLFMIHIQHSQALESRNRMWSDSGSPESDKVMHGYGVEIEPEVLDLLRTISSQLQVNVFWKIYWGDAREKICEAAVHLHLDTLAMGSRGLSSIRRSVQIIVFYIRILSYLLLRFTSFFLSARREKFKNKNSSIYIEITYSYGSC